MQKCLLCTEEFLLGIEKFPLGTEDFLFDTEEFPLGTKVQCNIFTSEGCFS